MIAGLAGRFSGTLSGCGDSCGRIPEVSARLRPPATIFQPSGLAGQGKAAAVIEVMCAFRAYSAQGVCEGGLTGPGLVVLASARAVTWRACSPAMSDASPLGLGKGCV